MRQKYNFQEMLTVFVVYLERSAVIQRALVMSPTLSALSQQILAPSRQVFTKAPPLKLEKQESEKGKDSVSSPPCGTGTRRRCHLIPQRCPSHDQETPVTEVNRTMEKG